MRLLNKAIIILAALHNPPLQPSSLPSPSRFLSTTPYTAMSSLQPTTAVSSEWLQEKLRLLMNSPYIHFNHPKLPGIRMGPGPVDLFSTRFNNMFTSDVTGVVAGNEVDKEGLKQALLALQRKWNNDSVRFSPSAGVQESSLVTSFQFTPTGASQPADVTATASIRQDRGTERMDKLNLDGDTSLFVQSQ
ncbi:hypothetical protein DAEQUDRAFT_727518 [Daedalea quercina L-15889]|uniref:Uncharacterized protein n=1 Tax=Daedalea quercina L-15889 TaxID=1314783 RepID=A0A165PUU4_9APHY|nr:hypothetical protein DAEQUDRAFT_727518 [Daedalea quercina L-15889]